MARKVSEIPWKTVADGVKELGEEKALSYLKKGTADMEYRSDRNAENNAILKAAKKDPRFRERAKQRASA